MFRRNVAEKIEEKLKNISEFKHFHHLHLWSLDGASHVSTVMPNLRQAFHWLVNETSLSDALTEFELSHTTVEYELHIVAEMNRDMSRKKRSSAPPVSARR